MSQMHGRVEPIESTNQLKDIFEKSLAVLCRDKDDLTADPKMRSIRDRSIPIKADESDIKKRAFDNAAKALATLWRVSTHGTSRLAKSGDAT